MTVITAARCDLPQDNDINRREIGHATWTDRETCRQGNCNGSSMRQLRIFSCSSSFSSVTSIEKAEFPNYFISDYITSNSFMV